MVSFAFKSNRKIGGDKSSDLVNRESDLVNRESDLVNCATYCAQLLARVRVRVRIYA